MNREEYPKPRLERISGTPGLEFWEVGEAERGHLERVASWEYSRTEEHDLDQASRLTPWPVDELPTQGRGGKMNPGHPTKSCPTALGD